jgi:hypothetical protein
MRVAPMSRSWVGRVWPFWARFLLAGYLSRVREHVTLLHGDYSRDAALEVGRLALLDALRPGTRLALALLAASPFEGRFVDVPLRGGTWTLAVSRKQSIAKHTHVNVTAYHLVLRGAYQEDVDGCAKVLGAGSGYVHHNATHAAQAMVPRSVMLIWSARGVAPHEGPADVVYLDRAGTVHHAQSFFLEREVCPS